MQTRILTTLLGLAIVAIPATVPASQPDVRLADLEPEVAISAADFALLLADPRGPQALSLLLPEGFTTLAVDVDPFAR